MQTPFLKKRKINTAAAAQHIWGKPVNVMLIHEISFTFSKYPSQNRKVFCIHLKLGYASSPELCVSTLIKSWHALINQNRKLLRLDNRQLLFYFSRCQRWWLKHSQSKVFFTFFFNSLVNADYHTIYLNRLPSRKNWEFLETDKARCQ